MGCVRPNVSIAISSSSSSSVPRNANPLTMCIAAHSNRHEAAAGCCSNFAHHGIIIYSVVEKKLNWFGGQGCTAKFQQQFHEVRPPAVASGLIYNGYFHTQCRRELFCLSGDCVSRFRVSKSGASVASGLSLLNLGREEKAAQQQQGLSWSLNQVVDSCWIAGIAAVACLLYSIPVPVAEALVDQAITGNNHGGVTNSVIVLGQSELGTSYAPVSQDAKEASAAFSRRVSEALELLFKAREAQAQGDFPEALGFFSQITEKAGDLALSEYARVGRALSLYEVGDRGEAILEMEDMSVSLKGYPEIHAALAAALYVDKHATVPAEQQFTIATLLDPRYRDLSWVRNCRHWPPSLVESLQKFILLR
ncbi:hypothetical protein CY35_11G081000 [Sphagnum magellanicum]|nr:hypothetical protein CY35_11G081000 [Sphagnum magellanicum]